MVKKDNLAIVQVHPDPSVLRKSFGAERKKTFGEAVSRNHKVIFRSIMQMHVLKKQVLGFSLHHELFHVGEK